MTHKSIILLSGGLDSFVALALCKEKFNVKLAITFDYGQKSFKNENSAAEKITNYFGLEHKIIELNWLKEILDKNAVWVPNRNALFLNIAAVFADGQDFSHIIFGANLQEAADFPDNTEEFIKRINGVFEFSTQKRPITFSPLIKMDKEQIVKTAIELDLPLEFVYSCYEGGEKHCGECPSCKILKEALLRNGGKYINCLFK